ncbi:MAG: GNAT family N-acetyltransferase [Deltaproteobacteria bacterium]|nr:GNAT family N-acetyltransferase [Deltaproteobacteria bacterium]
MTRDEFLSSLFEGPEWMELYRRNPDPSFPVDEESAGAPLFHGRISLSFWLKTPFPLPSAPVSFAGSPVTDLFPPSGALSHGHGKALVGEAVKRSLKKRSWALVVKDLPKGDPLEEHLGDEGFVPVENDPIWHTAVCGDLKEFLGRLSKGRRRGLEGRWKRFKKEVSVRAASPSDTDFIKKSYDNVRNRSEMRLEELSRGFFSSALTHPSCRVFMFEKDDRPFAFVMLWQKGSTWFDKYMGTDESVYREVSFYSMSILHLLSIAPEYGVTHYVAGQGCGKDKEGLGLERVDVRLWVKPLVLGFVLAPLLKRFMKIHGERIHAGSAVSPAELG